MSSPPFTQVSPTLLSTSVLVETWEQGSTVKSLFTKVGDGFVEVVDDVKKTVEKVRKWVYRGPPTTCSICVCVCVIIALTHLPTSFLTSSIPQFLTSSLPHFLAFL